MAKYVSLTFDDGPCNASPDTMNDMLDILEKHGVRASFFIIANKITEENKKVIRRAFDMGCDIQNHTWSHPFMTKLTKEEMLEEYNKCDEAIIEITGVKPTFFRPPFVDTNDTLFETIPTTCICGQGVEDWVPTTTADERYQKMKEYTKDGILYLLHVMEGNTATLEAVDRIIPELKEQGYEFVTVPQMFEVKNIPLTAHDGKLWSYC